jgi:rhomboid protease GluP
MLRFVLKPSPERPDKRRFWTGQSLARPQIHVSALDAAAQEQLFQAIHLYVSRIETSKASPRFDNQLTAENEFHDRLKSFAPIPWMTYGVIGLNVAVWITMLAYGGGIAGSPAELLLGWGGNAASEVQRGQWWRLLSAMFLHSGFVHVALNMLGLFVAGVAVERMYGRRLFALIYLGSGLVGSALSLHFGAQSAVAVGASGAVFGITGALFVAMLRHQESLPKTMGKQALSSMAVFILYSLVQGFARPGIDNAAHVGGLLSGCVLAGILPVQLDAKKFKQHYAGRVLASLIVAVTATATLAGLAPKAQLDQRGGILFVDGMRKLSSVPTFFIGETAVLPRNRRFPSARVP